MVVVLTTILSSENSSPFCQFLDGRYCTDKRTNEQMNKELNQNKKVRLKKKLMFEKRQKTKYVEK